MKKLLVILGVITCMVGLCACGEEATLDPSISAEEVLLNAEAMVEMIDMIVGMNATEQYASDPIIYAGLLSWQSALEDIGDFVDTNGGTVTAKGDDVVVNVNVLGSDHNAKVEFIFDSSIASCFGITTNVEYSFGELMVKAALNTVIGMGTVFVVLIFISLIISCFSLISKVGTKQQKTAVTTSEKVAADPVVAQIAEKEELAGDAELVAVIAAAIAAYEGSGSTDGFVVRSIRKSNKSKWQNA
ncbi:MAG: OadG family protein [Lachnospiraceae bacterium]|nr:OadG family protein [Lachnospiraceae bacterium]